MNEREKSKELRSTGHAVRRHRPKRSKELALWCHHLYWEQLVQSEQQLQPMISRLQRTQRMYKSKDTKTVLSPSPMIGTTGRLEGHATPVQHDTRVSVIHSPFFNGNGISS